MATLKVTKIEILGIEVVQSLQNMNQDMPLIQGKATYIRVYLNASWSNRTIRNVDIDANISIKSNNPPFKAEVPSLATLSQPKYTNTSKPKLLDQRLAWDKSLNFKLPDDFFDGHEDLDIEVTVTVERFTTNGKTFEGQPEENSSRTANFNKKCELYCRAVAYQYLNRRNQIVHSPTEGQLEVIRRFIEKAFPISKLHWSTITIDAPRRFNRLRRIARHSDRAEEKTDLVYSLLFQHLLALRNQDISRRNYAVDAPSDNEKTIIETEDGETWHKDTLYLGVIEDPSGRFGGAAMDTPQYPTPHLVAFAAAESDGALGTHELAHLLGRLHPGIPNKAIHGKHIGQTDQYKNRQKRKEVHDYGYISINTNHANPEQMGRIFLGLDCREDERSPTVLAYNEYFDLMTYQFPQWVSDHTYKGLYERIKEISSAASSREKFWTIIGEYNLLTKTGAITYVLESKFDSRPDARHTPLKSDMEIIVTWKDADTLDEADCLEKRNRPIQLRNKCSDANPYLGVFQHTIQAPSGDSPRILILKLEGQSIDIYSFEAATANILNWNNTPPLKDSQNAQSQPAHKTPGNSSNERNAIISLNYSVDKGGYFLKFNFKRTFKGLSNRGVAITSTIQFKRKWSRDHGYKPGENGIGDWETVAITHRLKESIWIHPAFIAQLESYRPIFDPSTRPYMLNRKNQILNTEDEFFDLKLNCRIIVGTGSHVLGVFEVNEGEINNKDVYFNFKVVANTDCPDQEQDQEQDQVENPKAPTSKMLTYGSTGPKGEYYFAPTFSEQRCTADPFDCARSRDSTGYTNKEYYRPSVNPEKLPCKKGKKLPYP